MISSYVLSRILHENLLANFSCEVSHVMISTKWRLPFCYSLNRSRRCSSDSSCCELINTTATISTWAKCGQKWKRATCVLLLPLWSVGFRWFPVAIFFAALIHFVESLSVQRLLAYDNHQCLLSALLRKGKINCAKRNWIVIAEYSLSSRKDAKSESHFPVVTEDRKVSRHNIWHFF